MADDGSVGPASTLAVGRLPDSPRTGTQATLPVDHDHPPHTPGQTEILAASTDGVDLLGQRVQEFGV